MIDPYEKIIKIMREQGRTEPQLFTGVLRADGSCSVGDLLLESGDYSALNNRMTVLSDTKVLIASIDGDLIILGKVV